MDFLSDFIAAMHAHGCAPADNSAIIPDDKKRRYQLADEKRGKQSGSYQFKIEGEYAVGWFRSFREGVTHKWSSRAKREFTAEEKAAWKAKIDQARADMRQRIRDEQSAAAAKAERIWARAHKTGSTPYLERKNISLLGTRVYKTTICVPVTIDGKIVNLQFIAPCGAKRFLTGAELVGGYFSIARKGDDLAVIIICEGYATAATIREATGLPVIAAFNAGNLKAVAQVMRKKYPESRIVICADNDAWTFIEAKKPAGVSRDDVAGNDPRWGEWRAAGILYNPGVDNARQAAVAIGGAPVVWPEFTDEHHDKKPTDFNDAAALYSNEYVKQRISLALVPVEHAAGDTMGGGSGVYQTFSDNVQAAVPPHPGDLPDEPPIEAYFTDELPSLRSLPSTQDWRELLLTNEEGKLKSSSLRNAILFLKFHKDFEQIFAYNEFHQNIMLMGCPPWERESEFKAKRLDDISITNCSAELEKYCINVGTDKAFKAIQAVSHERRFHPAREYFNALKWDGRPRLETWLSYYLGCESESADYLAFIGKKWLTAAVRRVFQPGCKFDHILVIEGEQGLGKSTALKILATFGTEKEESYFTDAVTVADIQNKDTIMKIQGSIIVELSELSGFSKREDDEIKRWIVLQHDDARLPYAREMSRFYRQFILAATTNKHEYLKDPSGNRRYWPTLSSKIDLEALRADREQLWAEAVKCYKDDLYVGPTEEEERLGDIEREKRLSQDAWTDIVLKHADGIVIERGLMSERGFKADDIFDKMSIIMRDRDDRSARRINGILQMHGYENKSMWSAEKKRTERFWVKKERR